MALAYTTRLIPPCSGSIILQCGALDFQGVKKAHESGPFAFANNLQTKNSNTLPGEISFAWSEKER